MNTILSIIFLICLIGLCVALLEYFSHQHCNLQTEGATEDESLIDTFPYDEEEYR
jgi:hypothetical protein